MAATASTIGPAGKAWTFTRCGGVAGVLGVVLFVVGVVMGLGAPTVNDSIADTRMWWADHGQQYLWSEVIISLGIILFLVPYLVALRDYLGRIGTAPTSAIAVLAVVFWLLVGASASTFGAILALGVDQIDSDGTIRALQWGDFAGFSGNSLALVPFFGATAGVFWKSKMWLGGISLLLAVLSLLGTFTIVTGDPEHVLMLLGILSTLGFGIVTLAISASMLMDEEA